MANQVQPRILPGFMELLPEDQILFNQMSDTIRKVYEKFGFLPLDTPTIELSEVLLAKAGGETEKQVLAKYQNRRDAVVTQIMTELNSANPTPYKSLSKEMQVYETFITTLLGKYNKGIIIEENIDTSHETYKAWKNETIGLKPYLQFLVEENCIDITKLSVEDKYSDSDAIYTQLLNYIEKTLTTGVFIRDAQGNASSFTKKVFKPTAKVPLTFQGK